MLKQSMKHKKGQQGFTLLEILVVVAIMGFLAAMVAPRFAGILAGTDEVVCDSNQQRMVQALAAFNEQRNGAFPNHLVNLIDKAGDGVTGDISEYRMPTTARTSREDFGPATFSKDFDDHHWFQIHILNAAEARELQRMGITTVYNLNSYEYRGQDCDDGGVQCTGEGVLEFYETQAYRESPRGNAGWMAAVTDENQRGFMEQVEVAQGLGVLMSGMGAVNTTDNIINFGGATAANEVTRLDHHGRNNTPGRIVFGIGPENQLVREGIVSSAGLCPTGLTGEKFTWNHYNLILPRLEASVERMPSWTRVVSARADEGEAGGVIRTGINLHSTNPWEFYVACPEGHGWPETDELDDWRFATNPNYTETDAWAHGSFTP